MGLGMEGMLANTACVGPRSSLPGMGVKRSLQSGGTLLGFLVNILMILSTATNYWIRFPRGHSGLWQECNGRICSNIPCQSEAQPGLPLHRPQLAPSPSTIAGNILQRPYPIPSTPVSDLL